MLLLISSIISKGISIHIISTDFFLKATILLNVLIKKNLKFIIHLIKFILCYFNVIINNNFMLVGYCMKILNDK